MISGKISNESVTNSGNSNIILGGLSSGVIVLNFAASEIGSVGDLPSNSVEWTSNVYVPVWFIGAYNTVDVLSLFFTG